MFFITSSSEKITQTHSVIIDKNVFKNINMDLLWGCMDMLFVFVCFAACPSVYLKIDCSNDYKDDWWGSLIPHVYYKIEKRAEGDDLFYIKGHFVGFIERDSYGWATGFRMRIGGDLPGEYFLVVGHVLGWVSYDSAYELRQAANAIDFGHTCLAPKWWKSGYVEEDDDDTFRTQYITEELFERRIEWLYKLNTHKDKRGALRILGMSEIERDREKANAVEEHLGGLNPIIEMFDGCTIQ